MSTKSPPYYEKTGDPKWKYKLTKDVEFTLSEINSDQIPITHEYFELDGFRLKIKTGYAWDGLSCFPDREEWLLGSVVHDTLIQMCELELISDHFRNDAHKEMRIILELTSNKFWAWVIYSGLMVFHPVYRRVKGK